MKKTFKASVVVAFIITIGLFLIETVAVVAFKKLPISLRLSGGDSVTIFGIGWKSEKIYPEVNILEPTITKTMDISFHPLSLILVFCVVWIVLFVILAIRARMKKDVE